MQTLTAINRTEADAIARRVTDALIALGVQPTELYLEETLQGLLITARIGDRSGACLVPPGNTATWQEIAVTLVGDAEASLQVWALPTSTRELADGLRTQSQESNG